MRPAAPLLPLMRFRGGTSVLDTVGGGASVLETAANIFCDIVPAGMLPISLAVTIAMAKAPPMVSHPLVVALVTAFALVSHRTLVLIAEAVEASGVDVPSLTEVWASSEWLGGRRTVWLIDAAVVLLCSGCCLFYLCFIGDLLSAAAAGMVPSRPEHDDASVPWPLRRSTHIAVSTVGALLPLCLLRDLSLLAPFSTVGVVACAFTTLFVLWRSLDGSYKRGGQLDRALQAENKARHQSTCSAVPPPTSPLAATTSDATGDAKTAPSATAPSAAASTITLQSALSGREYSADETSGYRLSAGRALPLINIISVAFVAHYNGAAYYAALSGRSVPRFRLASGIALFGAAAVYSVAGVAGYACFGEVTDCMALNNYARRADAMATVARVAMGVSLLASFPLMFAGLRTSALALAHALGIASEAALASEAVHRAIVTVGLSAIAAIAVVTPDASLVVGLVGAALGSLFIYSLPPALHLLSGAAPVASPAGLADVALVVFGVVLAVVGTHGALEPGAAMAPGAAQEDPGASSP